jgi:GNAT superfamily N-acetyltransferase
MPDNTTTTAEVVEATPEDITCILAWLKREYDEDGEGFWCNHNLVSDTLDRPGNIWVVRRNGVAVAFQLGRYSADILSVRKDYRNAGIGKALVQASIERAFSDDVNALSVQCEPKESLGFWERMGFVRYGDLEPYSDVNARLTLPRTFVLPVTPSPIDVVIGFYPESATYRDAKNVRPIAEHHVQGVHADDGSIMLDQRVIGLSHEGPANGNTVIKIEVGGVVRCFCKSKHEDARSIGVQYDGIGGTFFIDCIEPSEGND